MKICQSCGGSFKESLSKCPYCGTLNEEGAEREYGKKLNKIRERLDVVDELAVENFRNEVRLFFKVFVISLIICAFLAFLWVFTQKNRTSRRAAFEDERSRAAKTYEEIRKNHEKTAKWDALFEAGEYELAAKEVEENGVTGLYGWDHYRFFSLYPNLIDVDEKLEKFGTETTVSHYTYSSILADLISVSNVFDKENYDLSGEDRRVLKASLEKRLKEALPLMEMSEEEYDRLWKASCEKGYLEHTVISDYAKERWGQ